jgi:hypothetical protein
MFILLKERTLEARILWGRHLTPVSQMARSHTLISLSFSPSPHVQKLVTPLSCLMQVKAILRLAIPRLNLHGNTTLYGSSCTGHSLNQKPSLTSYAPIPSRPTQDEWCQCHGRTRNFMFHLHMQVWRHPAADLSDSPLSTYGLLNETRAIPCNDY